MSEEILKNTHGYNGKKPYKIHRIGCCYLNTSTKQYFWLEKPIEKTINVKHLVRMWHLDRIKEVK